jgi:uncharacterized protein YndB with AHSA1/START domain
VLVALRVRASPERAFAAFTAEIGQWWRPNALFQLTPRSPGVLSFEPGPGGRLIETLSSGKVYEVGRITDWSPPHALGFGWRPATVPPDQATRVHVSFEAVGDETRITVEHFGWDGVPRAHVARHGFPTDVFLLRLGEWWQSLLGALAARLAAAGEEGGG